MSAIQTVFLGWEKHLDIIVATETWLSSAILDSEFHIHGYNLIRKDRNRHGGGVAIYVFSCIPFKQLQLLFNNLLTDYCRSQVVSEPTRTSGKSSSTTDLALVSNMDSFLSCEVLAPLANSDHKTVVQMPVQSQAFPPV